MCRSVVCQSIAGLERDSAYAGRSEAQYRASVKLMLSNPGSRFWIRSTHPNTPRRPSERYVSPEPAPASHVSGIDGPDREGGRR